MSSKKRYGLNIGTSSILIIIVILCLVCFSCLSITSANADYRLSSKLAERTTNYYEACNQAQQQLLELSQRLEELYNQSQNQSEYESKIEKEPFGDSSLSDSLTFSYSINDNQMLQVNITPLYPETNQGDFLKVTGWQVISTTTPEQDNSLPVFGSN